MDTTHEPQLRPDLIEALHEAFVLKFPHLSASIADLLDRGEDPEAIRAKLLKHTRRSSVSAAVESELDYLINQRR